MRLHRSHVGSFPQFHRRVESARNGSTMTRKGSAFYQSKIKTAQFVYAGTLGKPYICERVCFGAYPVVLQQLVYSDGSSSIFDGCNLGFEVNIRCVLLPAAASVLCALQWKQIEQNEQHSGNANKSVEDISMTEKCHQPRQFFIVFVHSFGVFHLFQQVSGDCSSF